jgi:TatA/E family protein of Tat protein translocase
MPFINGIGPFELIIILVIALIVVGPGRLPDVGAALGKSIREFRKAATDVKDATSLEPVKAEPAAAAPAAPVVAAPPAPAPTVSPAVAAAPPVAPPPAPVSAPVEPAAPVAPLTTEADRPLTTADVDAAPATAAIVPDISDMPEPAPAADEQPSRTA